MRFRGPGLLAAIGLLAWLWLVPALAVAAEGASPLLMLDREIPPGEKLQLSFVQRASFLKDALDIPVFVARGAKPGPVLCLTAAIHGDELNGVEIARHVFENVDAAQLSGTLVALPFVNVWGFRSGNRYLPDRRDLNRAFPGVRSGSTASRIAYFVFEEVIRKCDALVDLHTGSHHRANLPQVRVDLENEAARSLALHFAVGVVLHGPGPRGSLRREAAEAGIPAILYEAGGPDRFEPEEIARGIEGVTNVMEQLRMVDGHPPPTDPQRVYRKTRWVRGSGGGIFLPERELGEQVGSGTRLGTVTDPVSGQRFEVKTPVAGTIIGMAHPQVVLPGYALFHIAQRD